MIGMKLSHLIKSRLLVVGIYSAMLLGCRGPTASEIAGTYVRTFQGLKEILTIKVDGTFEQILKYDTGKTLSVKDSWTKNYKAISFNRLYFTFDVATGKPLEPPELTYAVRMQSVPGALIVNADFSDRPYLFRKE